MAFYYWGKGLGKNKNTNYDDLYRGVVSTASTELSKSSSSGSNPDAPAWKWFL